MCSKAVAKIVLFVFNILFFVSGILLLSFGIAGIANPDGVTGFLSHVPGVDSMAVVINIPEVILSSAICMIVLGSIMLVFGFLGCAGAACEFKPLLFSYWILLALLIIAQISLIIYAAVSPQNAEYQIQKIMYTSLHKNFDPVYISASQKTVTLPSNLAAVSWVSMQFEVKCCGVANYTDYENFYWNNTFTVPVGGASQTIQAKVPPSCCTLSQTNIVPKSSTDFVDLQQCLEALKDFNTVGCYKAVTQLAKQYSYIPIGICSVVIGIEAVCMAMAIYLWRFHKAPGKV
jgi:hypothetical protein